MEETAQWFGFYCICGGSLTGRAKPDEAIDLEAMFDSIHSGEGHERTTKEIAYSALRRQAWWRPLRPAE